MIDLAMMAKLLDAIGPKTRLVLLGDPNQLASVEAGTVLADICGFAGTAGPAVSAHMQLGLRSILQAQQADQIGLSSQAGLSDTIVRFNKNHRFSAGSPIGQCALACLEQPFNLARTLQLFQDGSELQRLDHNQSQLSPAGLARIKSGLQPLLDIVAVGPGNQPDRVHHRRMLQVFAQHRVLCAHRKGPLGATQINQELSTLLRPRGTQQSRHWEGLPVIVRVNDSAVGRANGDVGLIVRLKGELVAAFPGPDELPEDGSTPPAHLNLVEYLSLARLPDHGPCYAMTIHKAQGSQWPDITVVLPARPSPILTRELLYTAITRARRTVAVLGPEDILAQALQTPIQRASGLGEALKDQASQ
jgi:exodeoxyribonuclease V alpha subunit